MKHFSRGAGWEDGTDRMPSRQIFRIASKKFFASITSPAPTRPGVYSAYPAVLYLHAFRLSVTLIGNRLRGVRQSSRHTPCADSPNGQSVSSTLLSAHGVCRLHYGL